MGRTARRLVAAAFVLAALAAARGPLLLETWSLPVSNDDAILLLMGQHVLHGELSTVLWNQPYNGALDAYLLAPLLALFGPHTAYRLYQLVCALLLVVVVWSLGRRLAGAEAGAAAALLAALGTPYMALMTATGPPPNFLMPLVTAVPLLAALRGGQEAAGWRLGPALVGLVAGLAVWNSSLAIPAFVGIGAGLAVAGWRPRPMSGVLFGMGVVVGALPLLVARLVGASGGAVQTAASAVTALRPRWQWAEGVSQLAHALRGLLGLQVPLVVDGPERAPLALPLVILLATGLLLAVALGSWSRHALPLLGWAGALAGAFWLSRRTGPDELRYLYGVNVPLLTLAGLGLGRAWRWRRPVAVALAAALVVPWAFGQRALAHTWRDPSHAALVWQVPPIDATVEALRTLGARSAYASLQFAGRLTLESEHRVIASQAWNERIPGDPLRFRDEVDLDPSPTWALSPVLSRGMPRADGFRELLSSMGGTWREVEAGPLVLFSAFVPPYDESRAVPAEETEVLTIEGASLGRAPLDRDPATSWIAGEGLAPGRGLVIRFHPARRLSALVVLVSLEASPLAVPWVASVDGEVVAEGPIRAGLQWVGGAPRAGKQALLVVPLKQREAGEVRLVLQGKGPRLEVFEVFLYGPDERPAPEAGQEAARAGLVAARAGRWDEALSRYTEAVRAEPGRATHHAAWARARWRAAHRRWLDVESLDDGGPELVGIR